MGIMLYRLPEVLGCFTLNAGLREPWLAYPCRTGSKQEFSHRLPLQWGWGCTICRIGSFRLPSRTRQPSNCFLHGPRMPDRALHPALPPSHCTVPGFQRGNPLSPQIDLQKMPLGKLSKRQIQAAYSILSEVQQVSEGLAPPLSQLPSGSSELTSRLRGMAVHLLKLMKIDDLSHNS